MWECFKLFNFVYGIITVYFCTMRFDILWNEIFLFYDFLKKIFRFFVYFDDFLFFANLRKLKSGKYEKVLVRMEK